MARLTLPAEDELSEEQRTAISEVVSGPRGKIPSPMIAWLRNPELASRGQRFGEVLRYGTSLSKAQVELATLVVARHFKAHQVWMSHKRHGLEAGLHEGDIDALASGDMPMFGDPKLSVVAAVADSLVRLHRLPESLYVDALDALGEAGLVEVVAVAGYYCLVSLTANAFELGLPGNAASELRDPDYPAA